jgi:hypothetical protein
MLKLGVDYSPYIGGPLSAETVLAWVAAGVEVACIAIDTAPSTLDSCRLCSRYGLELTSYRELSGSGYTTQVQGALDAFGILAAERIYFDTLWLTAEDQSSSPQDWLMKYRQAVAWASGYQVGVYSGAWFWRDWAGNPSEFSGLRLWDANYAALTFSPYGGWPARAGHQFAGDVTLGGVLVDLSIWETP